MEISISVEAIAYDTENTQTLESLRRLVARAGVENLVQPDARLAREPKAEEYPSFATLRERYAADFRYLRQPSEPVGNKGELAFRPVHIGLDAGSTMAKAVLADDAGEILFLNAYSNAGDTIETVKRIFRDLQQKGLERLAVRSIGITGSARYQVREALSRIYPSLGARVAVLVENYAHARGSIDIVRRHLAWLKERGVAGLNEDFCILVDIGGEDTKISTLALREGELFGNAMNIKCSAGTGSLMDTLAALFGIPGTGEASRLAFGATRGFAINATCAVFLMENAQKLQAQGVPREEILASATWAIIENMARTLWNQVDLPRNAVVLLHGQTMLSDPLPLAVTHRLQGYLGQPAYALVPPDPGHRACFGLIRTMSQAVPDGAEEVRLSEFVEARFEKRIIQCRGAACDDPEAVCNRTCLKCQGANGKQFSFTLGGCSAINELLARKKGEPEARPVRDTYKEIWDFIDSRHPKNGAPNRLVIPRSFCVSEWAYLLSRVFERLGIPVHVDNVRESDLTDAQPLFNVDSCAPAMGAVGQYRRLAGEPHGMILAPQIEYLPTAGKSLGRTCTTNQGGVAVAASLARIAHPEARIHLFNLDLGRLEADALCAQFPDRLQPVFRFYGLDPAAGELRAAVEAALEDHGSLRRETADLAASLAEEALAEGVQVALVVGREYILNPGIYDSHVRRLLRDKRMAVIPSYVLDLELDAQYGHIYWRNPHFIVSLLNAVAHRRLHERLRHPRLAEVFRRIETGPTLLPVVQVSTFSCGPDSMIAPFAAEIMKVRPFLLIQSDAVIKELAHLENRVNTYVKQLELGLHGKLGLGGEAFEIRFLDELTNREPLNPATDAIYIPTMGDNRTLTAVLRGAGFTCIDNYGADHDLRRLVKEGRKVAGDAVCAPLAGTYADLLRAVDDLARRHRLGDPLVAGKRRLLYLDIKGSGPCRQGQYADVHRLLYHRDHRRQQPGRRQALPLDGSVLRLLAGEEGDAYDIGLEEWALVRAYQGVILQGVLQGLLFAGAECRDYAEYQRFLADHRALKDELCAALERWHGPGPVACWLLRIGGGKFLPGLALKYFAYRLHDRALCNPLRRFARTWLANRSPRGDRLRIVVAGEVYMRVAQGEDIFRLLLANLGFGRFHLEATSTWSYLEYLVDEEALVSLDRIGRASRGTGSGQAQILRQERARLGRARVLRFVLRQAMARPLYRAARLPMPLSSVRALEATRSLVTTLRPLGELITYLGEALTELRAGVDVFLNVAPNGCMVASMGQVLTPAIARAGGGDGRIQHLFSADGDVDEGLLTLAVLKRVGPERFFANG